ncbi:MAG: hypothetical protein IT340_01620 [Chloroflexi bacterium]|nr:hypothetical protein [Chloroflexota bacterium]
MGREVIGARRIGGRLGGWLRVLAVVICLAGLLPPGAAANPAPVYRIERGLSLPVAGPVELALSGSTLIWQEMGPDGLSRLVGLDLRTSRRLPLPPPIGGQRQPAVSGALAAWIEMDHVTASPVLMAYDFERQHRTPITGPGAQPSRPAVDGAIIVWRDRRDGQPVVLSYDMVAGVEDIIARGAIAYGPPSISGPLVVWEEYGGDSWDVMVHDRGTHQTTVLAGGPDDQVWPRVAGRRVIYEQRGATGGPPSLRLVTVGGGPAVTLTDQHLVAAPSIAGHLVVWEDWRDGVSGVFVYDAERRVEQAVTRSEQARRPIVDGQTVAWVNQNPFGALIAVATLATILPTERRDPPLQADPNVIYFPETGHTIGYGFKTFWQQQGGLLVFGYPLTAEFVEPAPESGQPRTVQYFERFKLEYHANEPDPARQVKIARLGAEWLAGREPPRLPPVDSGGDRRYFRETGHTLAAGFGDFWDEHDGLRLLGFPITEEMSEGGRTVQYFERGRLEFHPEAPDNQRVAIGLLGRDVLIARGWLPGAPPVRTEPGRRPR